MSSSSVGCKDPILSWILSRSHELRFDAEETGPYCSGSQRLSDRESAIHCEAICVGVDVAVFGHVHEDEVVEIVHTNAGPRKDVIGSGVPKRASSGSYTRPFMWISPTSARCSWPVKPREDWLAMEPEGSGVPSGWRRRPQAFPGLGCADPGTGYGEVLEHRAHRSGPSGWLT